MRAIECSATTSDGLHSGGKLRAAKAREIIPERCLDAWSRLWRLLYWYSVDSCGDHRFLAVKRLCS